jgi:hypothetical protein
MKKRFKNFLQSFQQFFQVVKNAAGVSAVTESSGIVFKIQVTRGCNQQITHITYADRGCISQAGRVQNTSVVNKA